MRAGPMYEGDTVWRRHLVRMVSVTIESRLRNGYLDRPLRDIAASLI